MAISTSPDLRCHKIQCKCLERSWLYERPMVKIGYLCGVSGESCSSGDWKQAYSDLLVQYNKDFASAGITITHPGFLNEPITRKECRDFYGFANV